MRRIVLLGSTGSIGTQTLDVISQHKKDFSIIGLTAHSNIELLQTQIQSFKPKAVAVFDKVLSEKLQKKVSVPVYSGIEGINKIAAMNEADTVVNALVGSIGIEPTVNAIRKKKNIALANKETLVAAGQLVMDEIKKNKVSLLPIDSEHSALLQCIKNENRESVKKITLTASGGPFRNYSLQQLQKVTKKDALKHPTWKMGSKITIDSATLMNKGFEVIEAHWLYGIDYKNIDVTIHPQSIVHAMVEFSDNTVISQMALPDMKIPIQYALTYPQRLAIDSNQFNINKIKALTFDKPDFKKFPCLQYAYDVGKIGGTLPAVLNAANEVAVQAFLQEKISFLDIPKIIKMQLDRHTVKKNYSLREIMVLDRNVKETTRKVVEKAFK